MWFKKNDQSIELKILVKPNAKQTILRKVSEQELQIDLHAKPHQGKANEELIAYLASLFNLPKSQIQLKRGEKSRHKWVLLPLTQGVQAFIDQHSKKDYE